MEVIDCALNDHQRPRARGVGAVQASTTTRAQVRAPLTERCSNMKVLEYSSTVNKEFWRPTTDVNEGILSSAEFFFIGRHFLCFAKGILVSKPERSANSRTSTSSVCGSQQTATKRLTMEELLSRFEGLNCASHADLVQNFCSILQCDGRVAEFFLESAAWDVARAVNAFVSSVGNAAELVYDPSPPPKAVFNEKTALAAGTTFEAGHVVTHRFEFGNSGTAPWPPGCSFQCVEGATNFGVRPVPVPRAEPCLLYTSPSPRDRG